MAQTSRAPRVRGNLRNELLRHMSEAELKKRTSAWIKKGARNEQSAHNKIANEIAGNDLGEIAVEGIYLGMYETQKENVSMYIGSADTSVSKVTFPNIGIYNQVVESFAPKGIEPGTPIKLVGARRMENIFTGAKWAEADDSSNITEYDNEELKKMDIAAILWDYAQTVGQVQESGLTLVRGFIRFVNEVSDFNEDGKPGDVKPIIDKEDPNLVNLRLAVEDQSEGDRPPLITVNVKTASQLSQLLKQDIGWISEMIAKGADDKDMALMELSDMLQNTGVIAFGRAGMEKPDGTPAKQPYLNIAKFGWIMQS